MKKIQFFDLKFEESVLYAMKFEIRTQTGESYFKFSAKGTVFFMSHGISFVKKSHHQMKKAKKNSNLNNFQLKYFEQNILSPGL